MTPITYDFETFWTQTYSLSKMSFIEYIQSPLFEIISVSVKIGDGETHSVFGQQQVIEYLQSLDWSNAAAIAHNGNEFDHAILVWVCNCHPKLFVDTLCLSRPKHQSEVGGSLKKLSAHYGLADKDNTILMNTRGKRYADFNLNEMSDMAKYNKGDVENTHTLFKIFTAPSIVEGEDLRVSAQDIRSARKELLLSDMTARMICYPQFECDTNLLATTLVEVQKLKHTQLEELIEPLGTIDVEGVREQLASAPKFAEVLRMLGAPVPMKISDKTGKETHAFAKTDEEFIALLEHEDVRVQSVVAARLGEKSTLLETRLSKMITCAELLGGTIPVPLGYHSATTGRWGGRVWNPQNLPRINPKVSKLTDALRKSLVAPPGHMIVVSDSSGIELRVNHYLWDVSSTRELYAADAQADLYRVFAAMLYGKSQDEVTKDERQLAKVAQLGLGFGAGAATFQRVAKTMGGVELSEARANQVLTAWRAAYSDIVLGWTSCNSAVAAMCSGSEYSPDPRRLVTTSEGKLRLPSGRYLYYPGLERTRGEKGRVEITYGAGKNHSRIYGPLLDENIVQAIARDILADQALAIKNATGYSPALMVHDELVYVVPEGRAQEHFDTVSRIMRQTPSYLPGLVLWSEGGMSTTYGDAK